MSAEKLAVDILEIIKSINNHLDEIKTDLKEIRTDLKKHIEEKE